MSHRVNHELTIRSLIGERAVILHSAGGRDKLKVSRMKEIALNLGGAACKYVDAFDVPTPLMCADSTSTTLVGYSLLIAIGLVVTGWATAQA